MIGAEIETVTSEKVSGDITVSDVTEGAVNADVTDNGVGTYTVKLAYAGADDKDGKYAASEKEVTVVIEPADANIVVESNNVKYGTAIDYPIKSNCGTIDVIVGLDVHDETNLTGLAQAAVPTDLMVPLALAANQAGIDLSDMTLEDLAALLALAEGENEKVDAVIAKLETYKDEIKKLVDMMEKVQEELPMNTELKISVVPRLAIPENIGVYMVASILADDNYVVDKTAETNSDMDAGYLIITPNGIKTALTWNETDDNDVITLDKNAKFDFAASAKVDGSTAEGAEYSDDAAQKHVEYVYIGVDKDGELVLDRCTDPNAADLKIGAYAQVAYVANWDNVMYYAEPLARTVIVAPNVADVDIIDANGNENYAQAYTYGDKIGLQVTVDGKPAPVEGLKVKFIGSDTSVDGWYRDEMPTDAGVYTVVAVYTEYDANGELYKAGGAAGILIINPADAEIGLEDAEYIYDGEEHFATITNTAFDYITVAIDRDENIAYVNMPEDTAAHVERIVAMLPAEAETAANKVLDKYSAFDGDVQTATIKAELTDVIQKTIDADLNAEAAAAADKLADKIVEEFESNADVQAMIDKLEAELDALRTKIGDKIPDEVEAMLEDYIRDAVTVNEDGSVDIDTDKLKADLTAKIAELEDKLPASVVAELYEMKDEIVREIEANVDTEAIEAKVAEIVSAVEGLSKADAKEIVYAVAGAAYGYADTDAIKELVNEAVYKIEAQGYIDYAKNMLEQIKGMYGGDIDTSGLEAAIRELIEKSEAAVKEGDIDKDSLKALEKHIDKVLEELIDVIDQIPDGTIVFGKNPVEVGEYDCYAVNVAKNYKAEFVDAKLVIKECQTDDPTDPSQPTDPTDPTDPSQPTDPTDPPKDDVTQTGDDSNMTVPAALAALAAAVMAAVVFARRKEN